MRLLDASLHVVPELAAKVNHTLSRPYQVRSRRSAKLLARRYAFARELHAEMVELEDRVARALASEAAELAAAVPAESVIAASEHPDDCWHEVSRFLDTA